MKIALLAVVTAALCATAFGQNKPTFRQYSTKVERIKNIKVDLATDKQARMFRTNLRNAAKGEVNFAGHFILTTWGCGTNCGVMVIIDARNGHVYFPREFEGVGIGYCDLAHNGLPADAPPARDDSVGAYFEANSRLVVLEGYKGGGLNDPKAGCGDFYFEWSGGRLHQIKFIAGKRTGTT